MKFSTLSQYPQDHVEKGKRGTTFWEIFVLLFQTKPCRNINSSTMKDTNELKKAPTTDK